MAQGILKTAAAGVPLELEYRVVPPSKPDRIEELSDEVIRAHERGFDNPTRSEFALLLSVI